MMYVLVSKLRFFYMHLLSSLLHYQLEVGLAWCCQYYKKGFNTVQK
jgi:hypothetical protein